MVGYRDVTREKMYGKISRRKGRSWVTSRRMGGLGKFDHLALLLVPSGHHLSDRVASFPDNQSLLDF